MSPERIASKSRRATLAAFALIATLTTALVIACGSESDDGAPSGQDGGDGSIDTGASSGTSGTPNDGGLPSVNDGASPDECANAPDADIDCTGKCGPVRDRCTGRVKQCGGCQNLVLEDGGNGGVQACDLSTNTCTTPKVTCKDLGAECGTVKNTCGEYLDCPDTPTKGCPDGKECDPDTNKCRDCQQVTCKDLGYECGFAFLGCGPDDPAHQTDCGQCPDGPGGEKRTCNNEFHKCEPKCTPKSAKEICDAAKASPKKVECGVISDGCGGIVNCDAVPGYGCKAGESCGVHGIANRCDPAQTPDECRAQGRECGTIKSACTGKTVTCGSCPSGQVCNDNGTCGVPCTPKTCNDFKDLECGTFDDGCNGTITCGKCAGGVCDQTTNTCCKPKTCAADYSGKCGDDLPTGCGTATVDCNCGGTNKCTTDGKDNPAPSKGNTGLCCAPKTTASYANQCGTKLSDGCGGVINVNCPSGQYCVDNATKSSGVAPPDGKPGTCCTPTGKCSDEAAGQCDAIPNSCRPDGQPTVSCASNCKGATPSCVNGDCCTPAAQCAGGGGENAECHVTHPGNGCGSDRTCNCVGGRTCWCGDHQCGPGDGAGLCKSPLDCGSLGANACGTGIDNGVGGTMDCGCATGHVCSETDPGKVGQCKCENGTDNTPFTCDTVPGGPGQDGDECGNYADGCGGNLSCKCGTGQTCNTTPNPNVCCTPAAQCSGGGGENAECNVTKPANGCGNDRVCNCAGSRTCWCGDHPCEAGVDGPGVCRSPLSCTSPQYDGKCGSGLDNGVGGVINCGCASGHKCSTSTAGQTGTCICANGTNQGYTCDNVPNGPKTGGDACGTFSDGCGGNINCGCDPGKVCFKTPNPNTCCTPLACPTKPGEGTMCGTNIDNTCGGKINCGCPSGPNNTNWQCVANKCTCTKDTCRGRTGVQDDLCGGKLECGG